MRIINIDAFIPSNSDHEVSTTKIFSDDTLIDAELIVWNISSSETYLPEIETIHIKQYENYKNRLSLRKEQFEEFFNLGRSLVLLSPLFLNHNYKISHDENITEDQLSLLDCLPIERQEIEKMNGRNFSSVRIEAVEEFLANFRDYFNYGYRYNKFTGDPIFFIKDTSYVVAQYFKVKNGLIICLPVLSDISPNVSLCSFFYSSIIKLIDGLKIHNSQKTVIYPNWVKQYELSDEKNEKELLNNFLKKQSELDIKIKHQELKLASYNELKILFGGDSENLEAIVGLVLHEFGFEVVKPNGNRDDLIIKFKEIIGVVEIKGVSKSSAEKHAAQLQKWVSDYHSKNDYIPKGILIVNTFKDLPLENRKEEDFPPQMIPYCEKMGHCLISGIQLLCIYLDFKRNILSTEKIINLLFNTIGVLKYTKGVDKYIQRVAN